MIDFLELGMSEGLVRTVLMLYPQGCLGTPMAYKAMHTYRDQAQPVASALSMHIKTDSSGLFLQQTSTCTLSDGIEDHMQLLHDLSFPASAKAI